MADPAAPGRPGGGNGLDDAGGALRRRDGRPASRGPSGGRRCSPSLPPKGCGGGTTAATGRTSRPRGRRGRRDRAGALVHHALCPVLWGSSALDEWGPDPDDASRAGPLGCSRTCIPRGRCRRCGSGTNRTAPSRHPARHLGAAGATTRRGAGNVVAAPRPCAPPARRHAETGTVRGADRARYADLLRRGGSSRRFGTRLSARLGLSAMAPAASLWEAGRDRRDALVDLLGLDPEADPERDAFVETSLGADAVGLPLVQATLATVWGGARRRSSGSRCRPCSTRSSRTSRCCGSRASAGTRDPRGAVRPATTACGTRGEAPEIERRQWSSGSFPTRCSRGCSCSPALAMNRWQPEDRGAARGARPRREGWRCPPCSSPR